MSHDRLLRRLAAGAVLLTLAYVWQSPAEADWVPSSAYDSLLASTCDEVRSTNPCGIDVARMRAMLDTLDVRVGNPRKPRRDALIAARLSGISGMLARSECLSCDTTGQDPTTSRVIRRLRGLAAAYYSDREANPLYRRRVMQELVVLYDGSEIWMDGLETVATTPLTAPPRLTWGSVCEEAHVPLSASTDTARAEDPGWTLNVLGLGAVTYDERLKLALAIVADAHEFVAYGRFSPTTARMLDGHFVRYRVLSDVVTAIATDLQMYVERHGVFPTDISDDDGRPRYDVLPSLKTARLTDHWYGSLMCWLNGTPGIRIAGFEGSAANYRVSFRGAGFPLQEEWIGSLNGSGGRWLPK